VLSALEFDGYIKNLFISALIITILILFYIFKILFTVKPSNVSLDIEIDMVKIEGGLFMLGDNSTKKSDYKYSDETAQVVEVKDFYMSIFPVTNELWYSVMGINISTTESLSLPVVSKSWDEIQEFIKKLNAKTRKKYRLPTEIDWEYAASGGKKGKSNLFSGGDNIFEVAWFNGNSGGKIHEVGKRIPNELGLYDMSGNVWEWCSDAYHQHRNNAVKNVSDSKVLKGGAANTQEEFCRIQNRFEKLKSDKDDFTGFRLALDV
jgi:formylglycine-generating enzyme required for sulfatase activity